MVINCSKASRRRFCCERFFLGFYRLDNIKSAHIVEAIKDAFVRLEISLDHCRGQAYDGASNMLGKKSGVAARTKADFPLSIEVHCLGHCLNLEVKRVSTVSRGMRNCMDTSLEIIKLIKYSPKREKKTR